MNTININFITDQKEYWISSIYNEKYIIVFKEKDLAQQYRLSLLLGTIDPPWESPLDYTFLRDEGDKSLYGIAEINQKPSEWKDESCCQSGCPGCPWTIAQGI